MIPIVAHGLLGNAYHQEIVVGGGAQAGDDVKVLHDLSKHLSTQYGDGTPTTGWAISPSPSGIWLHRVERAFDFNYAPAYLMVSFLIPRGQRLRDGAVLGKISKTMILNHSKYINQNVIQNEVDWSFLKPLSSELESGLVPAEGVVADYGEQTEREVAYYDGDLSKMMLEICCSKFARYDTVFCGKGLLRPDKDYPLAQDVVKGLEEKRSSASFEPRINPPVYGPPVVLKVKTIIIQKVWIAFGLIAVIVIVLLLLFRQPTIQNVPVVDGKDTVANQINIEDELPSEIVLDDTLVVAPAANMVDMGFTSENGNRFYWAEGNLTAGYVIANNRSEQGALFYWGDTNFTSTGDYRRYHYDDWYTDGGWKKSQLFGGPNPPMSISGTNYDAAHVRLGGNWRLPTKKEFQDLINNSTVTKSTENGQKGYLFTSRINGNTLFFPRVDSWQGGDVGAYWSGSLVKSDHREAYYMFMTGSKAYMARLLRCDANAIRPVCDEESPKKKQEPKPMNTPKKKSETPNASDEINTVDNRIVISSPPKLFLCLSWENVKDNGKLFYEKYEVKRADLKQRSDRIIKQANEMGGFQYQELYKEAKKEGSSLTDLEDFIQLKLEKNHLNDNKKLFNEAMEQAPEFGL